MKVTVFATPLTFSQKVSALSPSTVALYKHSNYIISLPSHYLIRGISLGLRILLYYEINSNFSANFSIISDLSWIDYGNLLKLNSTLPYLLFFKTNLNSEIFDCDLRNCENTPLNSLTLILILIFSIFNLKIVNFLFYKSLNVFNRDFMAIILIS